MIGYSTHIQDMNKMDSGLLRKSPGPLETECDTTEKRKLVPRVLNKLFEKDFTGLRWQQMEARNQYQHL